MTDPQTPLARQLARIDRLPARRYLASLVLRRTVPFLGTAGVRFVNAELGGATLALDDRRRVHNHIRGMHAGAAALLAEATSGLAVIYHLPAGRLALLTRMEIDYQRRMEGGLVATARIDEATRAQILERDRSEVELDVEVRDETGRIPLTARLTWAWRPTRTAATSSRVDHVEQAPRVSPR